MTLVTELPPLPVLIVSPVAQNTFQGLPHVLGHGLEEGRGKVHYNGLKSYPNSGMEPSILTLDI